MKCARFSFIIIVSFIFCVTFWSCKKPEIDSDNSRIFDYSSGDTEKAIALIQAANDELKRIKILYNENETYLKDLREASKNQDIAKIKQISNDLVYVINDGFIFADSAKSKIDEAQQLNINPQFKDYLGLKEDSLDLQIEAFKSLHEAARLLRDGAGSQNKEEIENAKIKFKEKDDNFKKKMAEAASKSQQADELAKNAIKENN
ncbi:MAG: hypothetical protein ABIP06_15045 [Pyrinomonadaceae bacterium]